MTVKGCNGAGLCSLAYTNGVTVDLTPPVPGLVLDGCVGGVDVQYQASRYVWRVGVEGGCVRVEGGCLFLCGCGEDTIQRVAACTVCADMCV